MKASIAASSRSFLSRVKALLIFLPFLITAEAFCLDCSNMHLQELEKKYYLNNISSQDIQHFLNVLDQEFYQTCNEHRSDLTSFPSNANHFLKALRNAQSKHLSNESFTKLTWELYPAFIGAVSAIKGFQNDPIYAKMGYKTGQLSNDAIQPFLNSLEKASFKLVLAEDFDSNYITHPDLKPYEKPLNAGHRLYDLKEEQLSALKPIIEALVQPMTECLGSPWKIINVLCWETYPDAIPTGPNEWHTDGLPIAVQKVMIYLVGADAEHGTTELHLENGSLHKVTGPPGTWLIFKISEIVHRGVAPLKDKRIALELRLVPALQYDLRPYSAGFNAHYPKIPWHDPHVK